MTSQLMEYFNRQPRIGAIGTANRDGKVDMAVMGSPQMVDEKTVILGSGQNRTIANLSENPNAVFMVVEPGKEVFDWKGVRVYMALKSIETSGPAFEEYMAMVTKVAGEAVRARMYALVTFEITEIRPLIDMGQGWEQSI